MTDNIPNPYVGPRPFERQDSARFFGRDQEARELLSLIVANRAVVLYAQSGAGKTSLLNAQVAPLLEAEGFEVWPVARVQGPAVTSMDPAEIQNIYAFYALFSWVGHEGETAVWAKQTIPAYLQAHPLTQDEAGYDQPRVLIFDQLEELFTAFPARWQEREGFLNQIARALDNDPLLRVVFSLREDYLAQLDPYAHLLPRNLGVRFRLERMRPEAALAAIRSPLRETERNFAPGVAEQLVEDLRAVRAETLAGQVKTVTGEFVEPVQLQVVCQNLWEDLPPEVTTITAEHLRQFGDVDQALSKFYTRAVNRALSQAGVDEEQLRQWFETALITPAGTRGTVYRGVQETAGVDNTAVQILEDMHIIRGEIRAGSRWYELTHDRLIEPIQQANRQWHDARQAARLKRIRQIAIGIVTLVLIIGLGTPILSWLWPDSEGDLIVRTTATAFAAAVEVAATEVFATGTAQEMMAVESQGTVAALAETSTAQAPANETATAAIATATAETIIRDTAVAQTAVYQDVLNTTATVEAAAAATVAAESTITAAQLAQLRQPVRPLQPGISIGSVDSATAGTLSTFVRDISGKVYLLGPRSALGYFSVPVLQPGPIDGGKIENIIGQVIGPAAQPATGSAAIPLNPTTIDARQTAVLLLTLAELTSDVSFVQTIPGVGEITGVAEPADGDAVTIVGRTSGVVEGDIQVCATTCEIVNFTGESATSPFSVMADLAAGDEGAIVLDANRDAVGIVAQIGPEFALVVPMAVVLEQFNVTLATDSPLVAQLEFEQPVYAVLFNPAGDQLAVAGNDQTVYLFNKNNLNNEPTIVGTHGGWIRALAFTQQGNVLASADVNGVINLWDPTQPGRATASRNDHRDSVRSLQFSGNFLVSGSWDELIILWETAGPTELIYLSQYAPSPNYLVWDTAVSPDGSLLLSGQRDGTVSLWNMRSPTRPVELWTNQVHTGQTLAVAFQPDGRAFATAGSEGTIYLFNMQGNAFPIMVELNTNGDLIWDIQFSPDGQYLAAVTDSGQIYLWLLDEPATPIIWAAHEDEAFSLTFSPDGVNLATAGSDGAVKIWLVSLLEQMPVPAQ